MSIGCGIGFVENEILNIIKKKLNSNPNIYAIDPCLPRVNWLNKEIHFRKGYFPEAIKNEKFQYAYAVIDRLHYDRYSIFRIFRRFN